jgi:hypothetical protein
VWAFKELGITMFLRSIKKIIPTNQWMKRVSSHTLLKNLFIIGTHDSASYQVDHRFNIKGRYSILNILCRIPFIGTFLKKLVQPIVLTQHASIKEQLNKGIRFLDLRIAFDKKCNLFYLAHSFGCIDLNKALADIKNFIALHSSEVIIVHMKPDHENRHTLENNLLQLFKNITEFLYEFLWESDGSEYIGNKSLFDLRGKIIFCCDFYDNNKQLIAWRDSSYHGHHLLHSSKDIESLCGQLNLHWENKENPKQLFESTINKRKLYMQKDTGKLLQLDGAPTPRTMKYITQMIISVIYSELINIFRKKKKPPVVGIAQNARIVSTLAIEQKDFLENSSGFIFTIDIPVETLSSQALIQKAIYASILQGNKSISSSSRIHKFSTYNERIGKKTLTHYSLNTKKELKKDKATPLNKPTHRNIVQC